MFLANGALPVIKDASRDFSPGRADFPCLEKRGSLSLALPGKTNLATLTS